MQTISQSDSRFDDGAFGNDGNFALFADDFRAGFDDNVLSDNRVVNNRTVFDNRRRKNNLVGDFCAFADAHALEDDAFFDFAFNLRAFVNHGFFDGGFGTDVVRRH